ncbi:MAG: hypothetical protein CME65_11570 [Halobacteriovoraceae bacterium]|nr:hypothetical protein [Halobacteriovoraceae bacterium]|tara:strand:- start:26359 stop:26877 length:519 start_codon:yes stop_codon:yes gene_type:complete
MEIEDSDKEVIAEYGSFGSIERVNLDKIFNESVLLAAACFHPSTEIVMSDGTLRKIQHIRSGDRVKGGGMVVMTLESISNDLYLYDNTVVSGNHAVLEGERFTFVKSSIKGKSLPGVSHVVSIGTENHTLETSDGTVFSDYYMSDKFPTLMNTELLKLLNTEKSKLHSKTKG